MKIYLKVIETKKDYEIALKKFQGLFHAKVGSEAEKEAKLLALLIEDYENKHIHIHEPDPIEAIKFMMEQSHKNQKDLAEILGNKGNISKVLNIFLTKSNFAAFTIPVILLNTDIPNLCQYLWDDSKRDKESRELDNLLSNFKNNYESFLYKKNLVIKYQVKDFSTFKTVMLDLTKDESDYLEKNDNVNLLRFLELRLKATHDISTMKLYEDDLLLQNSVIEDYL